jgi:hypothetical protein
MTPDIIRKQARDAITGRFVSMRVAQRRPGTTVVETIRYPPRPKKAARVRGVKK